MTDPSPKLSPKNFISRIPFYYGWIILIVAALATFISGPGQTYSISLFIEPIRKDLGLTLTEIAGLYTVGSLTAAVMVVFIGKLIDILGTRIVTVSIAVIFGASTLWMSTVSNSLELLPGFIALRTFGQGALGLITSTLIAIWFIRYRGRAMAIAMLGSSGGRAILPPVNHLLIVTFGWRKTWQVFTGAIWFLFLPLALFLIRRSPESIGLMPDGEKFTDNLEGKKMSIPRAPSHSSWKLQEAMRTQAFWLLLFAGASPNLISTGLTFLQVPLLTSKGLDPGIAASIFSVSALASLSGSLFGGILSDRIPNRYLSAIGQIGMILCILMILTVNSVWQGVIYGIILGGAGGFSHAVYLVIFANYFGRTYIGSIQGAATCMMVAFSALGPLSIAFVSDVMESFDRGILLFALLPITCMVAALAAIPPKKE